MEVNGLRISRLRVGASDAAKPPEAPESRQEPPVEPELEPELERVVGQGESEPARSLESDNRAKEATGGQ
jgi:hypothetical protein